MATEAPDPEKNTILLHLNLNLKLSLLLWLFTPEHTVAYIENQMYQKINFM